MNRHQRGPARGGFDRSVLFVRAAIITYSVGYVCMVIVLVGQFL